MDIATELRHSISNQRITAITIKISENDISPPVTYKYPSITFSDKSMIINRINHYALDQVTQFHFEGSTLIVVLSIIKIRVRYIESTCPLKWTENCPLPKK